MPSLRNIVVATDFSAFSERVVQRAAQLAKRHKAELHLVHVVRPLDLYPGMTLAPDEFGHHDEELLQTEQTRLEAMALNLAGELETPVHAATRLGRAHAEIAAYAQEVSADLLAAGARGENTLMDLFLGSTASRLLRVARCPVLIVRRAGDEPYRQVLAAVDFSPVSASVVAHAVMLAGDAPVAALHVLGSEVEQRLRRATADQVDISSWLARRRDDAEKRLDELLTTVDRGANVARLMEPGFAPAEICQCIEDKKFDLVVLGRHGHGGGLQDWLLGSVSKDVALAATCDVLLINRADTVESE
jgi:nucleotide-binding universal stress UspA family protein